MRCLNSFNKYIINLTEYNDKPTYKGLPLPEAHIYITVLKFRHKPRAVRFRKWVVMLGFTWKLKVICVTLHSASNLYPSWCFLASGNTVHWVTLSAEVIWQWQPYVAGTLNPCASFPDAKGYPVHQGWDAMMISDNTDMRTGYSDISAVARSSYLHFSV